MRWWCGGLAAAVAVRYIGVFRMVTDLGVLLGALVPGAVADAAGLRTTCSLMAVVSAAAAAHMVLFVRETAPGKQ